MLSALENAYAKAETEFRVQCRPGPKNATAVLTAEEKDAAEDASDGLCRFLSCSCLVLLLSSS